MQIKYSPIYLIFFLFVLLSSCDINDSTDFNSSRSVVTDNVTIFIKDGTINSPGEIKIVNNSFHKIFVPFNLYPSCSFSLYSLQMKENNKWKRLSFDELQNKWLEKSNQDSVIIVCDEHRNPIEVNPAQSYKLKIANLNEPGEYQIKINYRYSETYDAKNPDKEIVINYIVK